VSISSEDEEDSLLRELNQALEGADDTDGGEDFPAERQPNQIQAQVQFAVLPYQAITQFPLAAWHSGHRVRLQNRRSRV
jgi:hypothetical protein